MDKYLFRSILLFELLFFVLVVGSNPPILVDADDELHLHLVSVVANNLNFEFYNSFLFHWMVGYFAHIINLHDYFLVKCSISIFAILACLFMAKEKIDYVLMFLAIPFLVMLSFTFLRDDWLYLALILMIFYRNYVERYSVTIAIMFCLLIIGFRYASVFLFFPIAYYLLLNLKVRRFIRFLLFAILVPCAFLFYFLLSFQVLNNFSLSFNPIYLVKFIVGPLSFVDGTIYTDYPLFIVGFHLFKLGLLFYIFSLIISCRGIILRKFFPFVFLFSLLVLWPYIFVDELNGPRQQIFGFLVVVLISVIRINQLGKNYCKPLNFSKSHILKFS